MTSIIGCLEWTNQAERRLPFIYKVSCCDEDPASISEDCR